MTIDMLWFFLTPLFFFAFVNTTESDNVLVHHLGKIFDRFFLFTPVWMLVIHSIIVLLSEESDNEVKATSIKKSNTRQRDTDDSDYYSPDNMPLLVCFENQIVNYIVISMRVRILLFKHMINEIHYWLRCAKFGRTYVESRSPFLLTMLNYHGYVDHTASLDNMVNRNSYKDRNFSPLGSYLLRMPSIQSLKVDYFTSFEDMTLEHDICPLLTILFRWIRVFWAALPPAEHFFALTFQLEIRLIDCIFSIFGLPIAYMTLLICNIIGCLLQLVFVTFPRSIARCCAVITRFTLDQFVPRIKYFPQYALFAFTSTVFALAFPFLLLHHLVRNKLVPMLHLRIIQTIILVGKLVSMVLPVVVETLQSLGSTWLRIDRAFQDDDICSRLEGLRVTSDNLQLHPELVPGSYVESIRATTYAHPPCHISPFMRPILAGGYTQSPTYNVPSVYRDTVMSFSSNVNGAQRETYNRIPPQSFQECDRAIPIQPRESYVGANTYQPAWSERQPNSFRPSVTDRTIRGHDMRMNEGPLSKSQPLPPKQRSWDRPETKVGNSGNTNRIIRLGRTLKPSKKMMAWKEATER